MRSSPNDVLAPPPNRHFGQATIFSSATIIYHPEEHSLRVSALNSKIFLMAVLDYIFRSVGSVDSIVFLLHFVNN